MTDAHWAGVQVGLTIPGSVGHAGLTVDELLRRVTETGAVALELDAQLVEGWLGAPPEPVLLHPPEDSFETGLLPIEEEVFEDELNLARATFAGYLRDWRRKASRDPLARVRSRLADSGVRVDGLRWHGLGSLADDEVEFAFQVARSLGARMLLTEATVEDAVRLNPLAARHQMTMGFQGEEGTSAEVVERVLSLGASAGVGIDIGVWEAAGNGSPIAFLEKHAGRVTHVHLTDRRRSDWSYAPFGAGDAPIRDVLQAIRDRHRTVSAIVALDRALEGEVDRMSAALQALDYCRRCLADGRQQDF